MALSYVWTFFFLVGIFVAAVKCFIGGDLTQFQLMVESLFKMAGMAIQIALELVGVVSLFLGFMKIAEKAGLIHRLSKIVSPFFSRLFPEVPPNHPAMAHMMMNFAANLLGLDNAATPFGLKAMASLQTLNPHPDRATNAQIMLTVLLTSGLTLIPIGVIAQRAVQHAANPTDVFLPIFFATSVATLTAIIIVGLRQRINLLQPTLLMGLLGLILLCTGLVMAAKTLPTEQLGPITSSISNGIILLIIVVFLLAGIKKKLNIFETFIEGAKEGFGLSVRIMPYLVAMLAAIAVLRSSGTLSLITDALRWSLQQIGANTQFVDAMPTALMKPLSGSGARAMMIDAMNQYGADSFVGRLSCIFQGATDTTFYILALYFGSINVSNTRYALGGAIIADVAGVIAAIAITYVFFA